MVENNKPRIFVWDLEFHATQTRWFGLKIYPGYIICFCCKELGKSKMTTLSMLTHPGKDPTDDRKLVRAIGNHLRQADLHIFHYGSSCDYKFIQTQLMKYGFPPLPHPPMMVDTCKVAQTKLGLKSNSLKTLAEFFKLPIQKMPMTEEEWYKAFAGDKRLLKKTERRCRSDVLITEKIYEKLRPLMTNHPDMSRLIGKTKGCPACSSLFRRANGLRASSKTTYRRVVCLNCGYWDQEVVKRGEK